MLAPQPDRDRFLDRAIAGFLVPHHPQLLAAKRSALDLEVAPHDVLVGRDSTRYHRFTESPTRIDQRFIRPRVHRITDKHHPGHIGFDHRLNHHGDPGLRLVEALVLTIGGHARSPHGRPATQHRIEQRIPASDIKIGVVLPGERRSLEIFRRARRTNSDIRLIPERLVGAHDHSSEIVGKPASEDRLANPCGLLFQVIEIAEIQLRQNPPDLSFEFIGTNALRVGIGPDDKAGRNGETRLDQPAKTRPLTPDDRKLGRCILTQGDEHAAVATIRYC